MTHSGTATQRRALAVFPLADAEAALREVDVAPFERAELAHAHICLLEHAQRQAPAGRDMGKNRLDLLGARYERRAVDAIFRGCPVVVLPGYSRPLIRVSDYTSFLERCTYDGKTRVR